jgi:hypothetical protein
MKVSGSSFSHGRTAPVGGAEKIRARRGLPAIVPGTPRSDSAFPKAKDAENMSRFGTRHIVVQPASGFAAQLLGQALGENRPNARNVNDAYAHAAGNALPLCLIPLVRV